MTIQGLGVDIPANEASSGEGLSQVAEVLDLDVSNDGAGNRAPIIWSISRVQAVLPSDRDRLLVRRYPRVVRTRNCDGCLPMGNRSKIRGWREEKSGISTTETPILRLGG